MSLTIGQVARAANVNRETIRYYEREGLLRPPPRTPAGYRQYSEEAVRRVRFVKRAQGLGFKLDEIAVLLRLRVEPGSSCEQVLLEAEGVRARIDEKIDELQRVRAALSALAEACQTRGSLDGCPILDALEETA